MKRAVLILGILLSMAAGAQDFGTGLSVGLSRAGYTALESSGGTEYLNVSVSPYWRWSRHWGAMADLSIGTAVAGAGAENTMNTLQAGLLLAPYFEQRFGMWYLDIMAGVSVRARQPFCGPTPVRLGPTVGLGPAAGLLAGLRVGDRSSLFAALRLERTLFDPLSDETVQYLTNRRAGNVAFSLGLRVSL